MTIFDGKTHAAALEAYIQRKLNDKMTAGQEIGTLLIVSIGDNAASEKYVAIKLKLCEKLGIKARLIKIPAAEDDDRIFEKVKEAFADPLVTGGIIQLPFPRTSLTGLLDLIPVSKDADCISSTSIAQINHGDFTRLQPVLRSLMYFMQVAQGAECTPVDSLVDTVKAADKIKSSYTNARVTVLGNGFLIGEPIGKFLVQLGFSVNINLNYRTGDKIDSDLLILGTGTPNLVNGGDISGGCAVLDFGSSIVDGKVVGDLNKDSNLSHLGLISLSPGGIGPLVVRFLILNFFGL